MRTLAEYNIRQIALAQLAMQLSTNSQLVGYARQRLIEYSTLDRKLTELAQLRQLKLPRSARTLSSTAREALLDIDSRLSDLRTPLFDQAYLDALNSDDQALAETLQPQLEKTEDAEIKTLASQNLEKVKAQQAKVAPVAKVIAAAVTAQNKAQQAAQKPAAKTPK